jgi:NADPH:quinone reductase-like Zn-dependent oxidoreductase
MKAIRVHSHGGPDVLAYEDVDIGQPGPGEVRVRNRAIGVNFVDIYLRTGAFAPPHLPFTPSKEGAGEVLAVGEGVADFAPAIVSPMSRRSAPMPRSALCRRTSSFTCLTPSTSRPPQR